MKTLFWMAALLGALVIPVAAQNTHTNSVIRMNRDCGIVGNGDETAALNTCIANLPNYSTLECDKPMTINTTGMVVNAKIGIVIGTGAGHHAVDQGNAYCKINYTGAAAGTAVDWDRVRDSKFKGFTIIMNDADRGIWIRQNGAGSGISTADTFEDTMVVNNHSRNEALTTGYYLGDPSGSNCDEMTFRRTNFASNFTGTPSGNAYRAIHVNVKGTRFEDVVIIGADVGWNWVGYGDYTVTKSNGYAIGTIYKGQMPSLITQDDYEQVLVVAEVSAGDGGFSTLRGRYSLCTPNAGADCTWSGKPVGTPGHPAFFVHNQALFIDTTNVKVDVPYGTLVACTSRCDSTWYRGFPDPGAITFGNFRYNPTKVLGGAESTISRESWAWTGAANSGVGNDWTGWNLIDLYGNGVRGIGISEATNTFYANHLPCAQGNLCIGDGQAEFTGVHSLLARPIISYTGIAGTTERKYKVMACSANPCSAGTRSIPSPGYVTGAVTRATLDGSNHVTIKWIPSSGAASYSILEENPANNSQFNELMTGVTCSTNPCTATITTDSATYTYVYPSDNETGGVTLRGAIKMGKSATQPAAVDFTYATVAGLQASKLSNGITGTAGSAVVLTTGPTISAPAITGNMTYANTTPVANLTTVPLTYNHRGTQQTAAHLVVDSCTLGTDCSVTLTGAAVFSRASSYTCTCQDETAVASCKVAQSSGSAFTITGTGTDTIRYSCAGN